MLVRSFHSLSTSHLPLIELPSRRVRLHLRNCGHSLLFCFLPWPFLQWTLGANCWLFNVIVHQYFPLNILFPGSMLYMIAVINFLYAPLMFLLRTLPARTPPAAEQASLFEGFLGNS